MTSMAVRPTSRNTRTAPKRRFSDKKLRWMYNKGRLDKLLDARTVATAGEAVYKGLIAQQRALRELVRLNPALNLAVVSLRGGTPLEGRFQTDGEPDGPWVWFKSRHEAWKTALFCTEAQWEWDFGAGSESLRNRWVFRNTDRKRLVRITWRRALRKVVIATRFMWALMEMAARRQCAEGGRLFEEDMQSFAKAFPPEESEEESDGE